MPLFQGNGETPKWVVDFLLHFLSFFHFFSIFLFFHFFILLIFFIFSHFFNVFHFFHFFIFSHFFNVFHFFHFFHFFIFHFFVFLSEHTPKPAKNRREVPVVKMTISSVRFLGLGGQMVRKDPFDI